MVPSLSENIGVGFHHHVSISEMPSGSSYIPGHTIEINVVASGPLDKETGMIIDFSRLKGVIKTLLDKQFDHVTLLPPESEQLLNEFRKRGMRLVQTNGGSINGLPIVIFDTLVRANLGNSEVHLDNIRISNGAIGWHIKNNDGSPRISTLTKPENASIWTSDLHFSHRIPNIGKCDGLHGHNWSPKITFNRPLRKDEYMRITGKIKGKLEKLWGNKAILQSGDDFANFLKKIGKRVRKINSAPTTEMIAISMIREIEKILRQDGAGITLAHFELWETPTNFVTTI